MQCSERQITNFFLFVFQKTKNNYNEENWKKENEKDQIETATISGTKGFICKDIPMIQSHN